MREYGYSSVPNRPSGWSLSAAAAALVLLAAVFAPAAHAGFATQEAFLPAIGRIPGALGSQFYTTVWITNLTGAPVSYTFQFLKTGQANVSPASFDDSVAAGETKMYENVVETKFGLASALGAGRIIATGDLLVAERIYNQPSGAGLGDTEGMFFAGVPKSFSIQSGESATIQGVNQGGGEDFRYNFALVETAGGNPTVNVQVFDAAGVLLGQKAYLLSAYEQLQAPVTDVVPAIATTNARITATVTGGAGAVILAGAQVTNGTSDNSGFEMSFKGSLLGGGGGGSVVHDATLQGDGSGGDPLGLALPLILASGVEKFQVFPNAVNALFAESDEPSNTGVAIWGRGRNIAVYGEAVDGSSDVVAWGELGRAFNGNHYGVLAGSFDPAGSAMFAQYVGTPPGTALELQNGALKVSGPNPTAFVHVATAGNTGTYITTITNPLTDGDPNALLFVTHTYNPPEAPDGHYLASAFSVWYDPSAEKWTIYIDDGSSILGNAFNVLVVKR